MLKRDKGSGKRNGAASLPEQPLVKSIYRAICILTSLSNGSNSLTDIARSCQLSKSTVHRLLKALEESRLVTQQPRNHRYYLGPLIARLTSNPQTTHELLITCALGEMQRLSDIAGETVTVGVMIGLQYIILHEIPSKHDLRVTEEHKRLGSLYAGATVKVLLSQFSDEELKVVMKHINIMPYTGNTVTDKASLTVQIKETRQQGYAVTYGEMIPGVIELAVPLLNYSYPAYLSILGPESRLREKEDAVVEELKKSAASVSRNITELRER